MKGKFELATDEYDTEAEKPKAQSAKLKGKFYSRDFDGNYRFICDEDAEGADATIISGWFSLEESLTLIEMLSRNKSKFDLYKK